MSLFLLPQSYQLEVDGTGYDDNGDYSPGELETFNFLGTIQPLSSRERMTLPEGEKDKGAVKVYSSTRLPVSQQGDTDRGALVEFAGELYRCKTESVYMSGLINHYKYIAYLEK